MCTHQLGGFIPGSRNTVAWGLLPVESEIPLVTVTENAGLLLEGLWSLGVYEHPRREEASGKAAGAGVGARGSAQLCCPLLGTSGSSLPLCCLLGGDEAAWEPVFPRTWQLISC